MTNGDEKIKIVVNDCIGGTMDIRTGNLPDLPAIHQFKGYNFQLESVQSLIDLILRKGDPAKTIISGNESGIYAVLDDTITDRPQDTAYCPYLHSLEFSEWSKVIGDRMNQKTFVEFLRRRPPGQVNDFDKLMAAVQTLKINVQITGESVYEDNNNVSFVFKSSEKEGKLSLPKTLLVWLPLVLGSADNIFVDFDMEFCIPKSDTEKPSFVLSMPRKDFFWRQATQKEFDKLKTALPGYLILDGKKGF